MKFKREQTDFIKTNQAILKQIISERIQDYFDKILEEKDTQRREVLCLMVKELKMVMGMIDNLSNLKETKKLEESFTGV